MEENEAFLKYLIDEEIYLIEDKRSVDTEGRALESRPDEVKDVTDTGGPGAEKQYNSYMDTTVLLLDFENQNTMTTEHTDLLTKILQSVNLDLNSVEIIYRTEFDQLGIKSFTDCPVIAFLPDLPDNISTLFASEKYMSNPIEGNQFIYCDTINDLNKDRSLKRKLWDQLKLIYGL